MNKKIAIIPIIVIIGIIAAVSQMGDETTQTKTVEIETVEEVEATVTIPVKAARPACGPHPECYIPSYYVTKIDEPVICLLYTSPSPRDISGSRMPSSA